MRWPWSLVRATRRIALVVVPYLGLRETLALMTARDGLLTPSGSVNAAVALVGVAVLVLRMAVFFLVPALVVHQVARLVDAPKD